MRNFRFSRLLLALLLAFLMPAALQPGGIETSPNVYQIVTSAVPAAGAEVVYTLSSTERWRPIAVSFTLTTVGAGNRAVHLQWVDDTAGGLIWKGPANVTQVAALTYRYSSGNGLQQIGESFANVLIPAPLGIEMKPAWHAQTITTNLQAGDQYSAMTILVQPY